MFCKKDKKPEGPSFPFIENDGKKIRLKYDGMKVEQSNGQVSITFMQGEVPVYAYTYNTDGDYVVNMDGMAGDIEVKFIS